MKILIVDDELVSREKLRKIMDSFGQCIVVENGPDALQIATSQNPPDLILLDIIMPGMDGYEVCKRLKAEGRTSDIPVIFISSKSGEEDEARGLELGAVDYITKPFSPSIVKTRVRTHLELKKHRDRLEELVNERTAELKKTAKKVQIEIAERKQAEQTLRQSEERYSSIVQNSLNAIILYQTEKILFANEPFFKIFGYRQEELQRMVVNDLFAPEIADDVADLRRRRLSGEIEKTAVYESKGRRKGGEIFDMEISVCIVSHQGEPCCMAFLSDISKRKETEEALRKSEEKFSKLFFSSPAWAAITRLEDGKYIEVNKTFEEITGFDRREVLGRTSVELGLWYESKERKRLEDLARNKGGFREQEITLLMRNGDPLTGLWSADVIDIGGESCLISTVMDITTLRRAEADQKMLQEQLQRASKMEAIGTLAGGVAHDLNNILGGLVSYPELLLLQLPEDSPLRKSILTIQKSGEKAAAVVQDLLTLARRGVVTTEVVNINDVTAEYLESPEHEKLLSYHPGIHLETHLATDALNILGSSTHLSKTVMNLVSNAAEAMPEGGKLTISTENRYIDRPVRGYDDVKEGDYVVLTISDTGTGISPDDMDKIFEPFYTKKKMGRSGTGLGMAVVWGTVKDHNGYIDVQSIEGEARPPRLRARDGGQGTTFTLYFPVTRKELSEDKSYLAIESYSGDGESILIVDDVEEQRQIASGILMELGYSVISVSSGEEAVAYLRTNKADLLVLDMIMDPGMDGLDTYKKILKLHPGQKAIIASGFSETNRVKKVQNLGAGAYIRKPFLLEKIGLAVKEELEK
jgi:PAS domain S-box-containing protein